MLAKKIAATTTGLPKLAAPAMRALRGAGLTDLANLSHASEADVIALHGMGPNAMKTIRAAMKARGLSFAKNGKRR